MYFGVFYEPGYFGLRFRRDDQIGDPRQSIILNREHLFLGLPMTVTQTRAVFAGDLVGAQKFFDRAMKREVLLRGWNVSRKRRREGVVRIEFDAERFANPWQQPRQFFAAEFVTAAQEGGVTLLIYGKAGVAESPNV